MIKILLFSIFGVIKFVCMLIINLIAKIITTLSLSLPFFYMLGGLILHLFFGILSKQSAFFSPFHFGLIIVFIISGLMLIRKMLGNYKSKPKQQEDFLKHIPKYYDKPQIFRISDNPDYVVYEFYDKFQIFKETPKGLQYIRTDIKNNDTQ